MNKEPPPLPANRTAPVPGFCTIHAHNYARGRCRRCQLPFCDVCEVRWQNESLCLACLNQILQSKEPTPGEKLVQLRQGKTSLLLAIVGWLAFLGSFWMFWSLSAGGFSKDLAILNLVLFLSSFVPALFGIGQACATLRSRGLGLKLATWGLVLASLQIGVTVGVVVVNITHN